VGFYGTKLPISLIRLVVTLLLAASSLSAQDKPAREPGTYVVFETSLGRIVCKFYEKEAPETVANFIGLAEGNKEWTHPETGKKMTKTPYFDNTVFHRVIPDFMIQAGDPTGKGTGWPGYTIKDEIVDSLKFDVPGRLAMANSGPNTAASQFFITEVPTPHLNGGYTIFGQVVEGQELVGKIARAEEKTRIIKVTIERVPAS
jgi:peptidyl-prolyl cis-trans isomerase A (cyclophilin A)